MRRRRATAAAALFLALAGAPAAHAFSTHPAITATRNLSPGAAAPGQTVVVTMTVELGAIGADPVRGFFLTDHVPEGLAPTSGTVYLDGAGIAALHESLPAGSIYAGCTTHRWVLETPPSFSEDHPVGASSTLAITYTVTIPTDAPAGDLLFPGFTWVGMITVQGDGGDHFGYEDAPAALTVVPPGDDRDGDGMPDAWETAHGLDPDDPADAAQDPDGDGLANLDEYHHGTDPQAADTDGDGMPDGWEVEHDLNAGADDARADADGDGYTNLEEYEAGTDPRDPDATPAPPPASAGPRSLAGGCACAAGGDAGRSPPWSAVLLALGLRAGRRRRRAA